MYDHLVHRGFLEIRPEPDGNVTPDLLVNGSIAIEVRRLNQHIDQGNGPEGLENLTFFLHRKVRELLERLGPPVAGESWFVHYSFSRPCEDWRSLAPLIRNGLQQFASRPTNRRTVLAKAKGFELEVFSKASSVHEAMFVLAGYIDQDSGGWLLSEMETNIRHCVAEKSRKVSGARSKYPVWWLALVDYIGLGLSEMDRAMFRDQVAIEHDWDKILIIDPRDCTRSFEL